MTDIVPASPDAPANRRCLGRRGLVAGRCMLAGTGDRRVAPAPPSRRPPGRAAARSARSPSTAPAPRRSRSPSRPSARRRHRPARPRHRRRDHQQPRPLRPVPPDRPGRLIGAGDGGDAPNFQNWKAIGAQALVTGRVESRAATSVRVEFRLWDVLPRPADPGHRLHHHARQLAPHRPHHQRRDLRAAAGREGLFRHPHRLHRRHRPARPPDQAAGDHGPGRRQQPLPDRRLLAGADAALPPDARPDRLHVLRQQQAARVYLFDLGDRPPAACWAISTA